MDVKNAFLFGDLTEQVFIEQHLEYVVQRKNNVCHLKKVIYGLKQSPRAWLEKFNNIIMQASFQWCVVDPSVLIRKRTSGSVILVDDILLISSDTVGIMKTKEYLYKNFVTKDISRNISLGYSLLMAITSWLNFRENILLTFYKK